MTEPLHDTDELQRTCPRCGADVTAERHAHGSVRTLTWRCGCGWSRVTSESGVLHRGSVSRLLRDPERD